MAFNLDHMSYVFLKFGTCIGICSIGIFSIASTDMTRCTDPTQLSPDAGHVVGSRLLLDVVVCSSFHL